MDEYKQIECISKMKPEYFENFCCIVDEYREKLPSHIVMENSAFTLHDFDHHCFDIYKIISEVLFDRELAYMPNYGLSERELYILNLAVLFHDIGMTNGLVGTRENHSLKSAEYVEHLYNNSNSVLTKKGGLTKNELTALKVIIIAHSNIKDGTVKEEDNGLNSTKLKEYPAKVGRKIRTKFLAGILRLADELDVSVERVGTGELEQEIEEKQKEYDLLKNKSDRTEEEDKKLEQWKGFEISLKFWHRLHLIASVERSSSDRKTIQLIVDDDYIQRQLDGGQTEIVIARELNAIYDEIKKKMDEAIKIAFSDNRVDNYIPVRQIEIVSELTELNYEIKRESSVKSLTPRADSEKKKKLVVQNQ